MHYDNSFILFCIISIINAVKGFKSIHNVGGGGIVNTFEFPETVSSIPNFYL